MSSNELHLFVLDVYGMPECYITQKQVFEKQQLKYIIQSCPKVAVLSAFPLYVLDYYGVDSMKKLLEGE